MRATLAEVFKAATTRLYSKLSMITNRIAIITGEVVKHSTATADNSVCS